MDFDRGIRSTATTGVMWSSYSSMKSRRKFRCFCGTSYEWQSIHMSIGQRLVLLYLGFVLSVICCCFMF